jgi:hypothetical protein
MTIADYSICFFICFLRSIFFKKMIQRKSLMICIEVGPTEAMALENIFVIKYCLVIYWQTFKKISRVNHQEDEKEFSYSICQLSIVNTLYLNLEFCVRKCKSKKLTLKILYGKIMD